METKDNGPNSIINLKYFKIQTYLKKYHQEMPISLSLFKLLMNLFHLWTWLKYLLFLIKSKVSAKMKDKISGNL